MQSRLLWSGDEALHQMTLRSKKIWVVVVALTVVRLVLAALLPLTPDEAYYWVWSRHLQGGYLDHPFMVAFWIRAGTDIVGDTALGVRLLGPLSALLGSWVLYRAAQWFVDGPSWRHMGERAVLLLNATLMLGLGAATMTPDTPLLFFITITLYLLGRALAADGSRSQAIWWIGTGIALGLAFDSKYTAALIGMGVGGYVLTDRRRQLLRRLEPWCAIPAFTLTILPVLYWNGTHHWASFLKQGGRTGDWHPGRAIQFIGELLGGQIGLATPLVFVVFVWGVYLTVRKQKILAWLVLLPASVFVTHALGDRVQANWPAVIYPVLALAGALTVWRLQWAIISGLALTTLVTIQAITGILPLTAHQDPIFRQTAGWTSFAQTLAQRAQEQGVKALIVSDYALASELAFSQHIVPVIGDDSRWALFPLQASRVASGWQVGELRSSFSAAERLCRYSGSRMVRCYSIQPARNVGGAVLPMHP